MPIYTILTLLLPFTGVVSGWSAYNQPCTPYHSAIDSCDPHAFLTCDRFDRSPHNGGRSNDYFCKCSSPEYVWAYKFQKCVLSVGSNCFQGRGVVGREGFNTYPSCAPGSQCDIRSSYTCKCHTNFLVNADGSACNEGTSRMIHTLKGYFWFYQLTLLPCVTLGWGLIWFRT